ncbi:calcium/sodium antiporter [Lutimaribacter sp. EGI FJ00015]|uniref:Calcium/sodium antiporter n=1 Tax=Lutimaribacter degradans TaxID=2945989 RepID=A0ACC6A0F2_9RHOB|nr:calcium/sodium antiporter [Lutimaribacter sp. EGI FJ00013]MCM2563905.1 calcium/sodium antiporter [Lutimaribacter sp. EGI FJ00013]MCO0615089.1 calcium/sodium antiporter [Lutimaribacter sp. EGI FJ00015]MCO0637735.1 calcium/sodium antiporter [Lutimaribacter sp. EGI FJ00014]
MTYLELAAGLVLLLLGGDLLVRGAVALAARLGLSPLLIGLTIVGFGTSTPELVTSINAALAGAPGIALGNVVGSNIANIGLILGLAALIAPISVARGEFRRDAVWLLAATLVGLGLAQVGVIGRGAGAGLLVGMAAYLVWAYVSDRRNTAQAVLAPQDTDAVLPRPRHPAVALLLVVGGIAATVWGAHLLVGAAMTLARGWQVPEAVIGLTLVAVGTSLPELATSVMAALRRQGAVAFGNVVGSNIFNLLGILGATALLHPLRVPAGIAAVDVWVMLAATLALIGVAVTGWRIRRAEGAVLLALYVAYIAAMALRGGA